jgi:hypothetical protein
MRRRGYIFLFVLAISGVSVAPAYAEPGVELRANFNNGKLDQWQISGPGTWSVQRRELVVDMNGTPPGTLSFATAGDRTWGDYEYEFDVRGELGVDKLITFHYRDPDNLYNLNIRGFGDIFLQKNELGVGSTLVGENPPIFFPNFNGTTYHGKIVLTGPKIDFFIDGVQIFSYLDAGTTLTRGKIGFLGYSGGAGPVVNHFDNVVVRVTD